MDWKTTIHHYSMRIAGNRWDAEDLAQDTILKVMKALQSDPARPITKAYLYRIALNTWRDKQKRPRLQAAPFDHTWETAVPDNSLMTRELLELLVDRLPPRMAVVLLLMDVFDLTARETADLIASKEAAVHVTLGRARTRLRQLADQFSFDEALPRKVNKNAAPGRLDFEALVEAFRQHNPRAICEAYLGLADEGITLTQLQSADGRLHFTFRDLDGNLFSLVSQQ